MKFTHLHVHSHYSLLDGLGKIEDIIARTKALGMDSIALTDHGNLYGAIEFYKKAKKEGLKPILGMEAYLAPHGHLNKRPGIDELRYHLILLAKNKAGWKNLVKLATIAATDGFYYKPRIDKELLLKHAEGLVCLSACFSGEIARLLSSGKLGEAEEAAKWYQSVFGEDFYLEIQPHEPGIHKLVLTLSEKLKIPIVATQDVHYVLPDDKTAHEILLAVQTNTKLEDRDRFSFKNFDVSLRSPEEMAEIFKHIPEAIENTGRIADKCNLEIDLNQTHLPTFPLPEGENAMSYLNKLVAEKLPERYKDASDEIKERVNHELSVIEKTGFANYFLIVQDFVNWAKSHGIVVGPGRGSAAGSIVSYILGITDVDPLKYDLLFERFLNPDRIQVPDIDIDFTDTRRDEVIAYIKDKYGHDKVAQIITFGTMMARAAIRDAGRALGLPYGFCDQIAKLIPFNAPLKQAIETVPELKEIMEKNEDAKKMIEAALKLEGTVRHASVHACGIVISSYPLVEFVPLQRAPQGNDAIITQFEMHSIEDLGLLKMDLLGLRNLTIIEKTLRLVKELHGIDIDVNNLPLNDEKTFELFQSAEMTGVFQLESSGMRRYLKELKPTELEDIIVMISLYRPGPMELIPLYIKRKFGREKVSYIHPRLEPILEKTYGVGVYQEQMMRIARDLAGFTLAEADTLRKAIGKKIKKLLDEQKEKLLNGLINNGIDIKTAHQIWELFPPFARYGFNKSHGAAYALISYRTAYLKAHFPVEFMTSLLNVSENDVERINFLINEAKRLKIKVLPPDVNQSLQDFTVDGGNIRFGLLAIKNLGGNIVEEIIKERSRGGPFRNFSEFLSRIQHRDLNKKSLEALIKCGALDSLGVDRAKALGNIEEIVRFNQAAKKMSASSQDSLFGNAGLELMTAKFANGGEPTDKKMMLIWEKELLGLYITDHPFNIYAPKLKKQTVPLKRIAGAKPENIANGSARLILAGVITGIHKIFTKRGDPMLFVNMEDNSGSTEVLVFSDVLSKNPDIWQENKAVMIDGRLSFKGGEPKVIVNAVKEL
ncbi:MAG TPA: DNA polymerase III subunit alpha [Candidatus Paceibacterota bacterium]|nr:DNA polymerase III subunit alpha [Candidatus Paceibacterota bacterium]